MDGAGTVAGPRDLPTLSRLEGRVTVGNPRKVEAALGMFESSVDTAGLAETGRRLKAIVEQIEALEARWLELSTQLDEIAESVG